MGLMDKFKNLFTDEEIIEEEDTDAVEIKEIKKEEEVNKLPTFMREKIEKEEKNNTLDKELKNIEKSLEKIEKPTELELPKIEEKPSFKFPIDLEENDFVETRSRQSIHKVKREIPKEIPREEQPIKRVSKAKKEEPKVADLYKDKKPTKEEINKPRFRATPIISPIYGVLDKNYTSTDIDNTSRNDLESNRHSKNVDFDSVRKKAYGSLSEEIKENLMCENCEYLKEVKECHKKHEEELEDNIVYERLDKETNNTYRDVTLDEATENYYDYGVEYEKEIDPYQEKHQEPEEEIKISNFENKPKKEIPPVKSSINLLSTLKKSMGDETQDNSKQSEENLELTDDLFNLIDSMYDERND